MHRILRVLILSDLFILGGFGLIQPVFAIFILQQINQATVTAVGLAVAVQLLTKALFQSFVGRWSDEERGNRRELGTLFVGSLIMSLVPLGYFFSHTLAQVFFLQFAYGLGGALAYPGWMVIFTRYLRHDKAGYEWGAYNTIITLGTAATAFLGAYIVDQYSFQHLFVLICGLSLLGTSLLTYIFKHEFTRGKKVKNS